MIKVCSSCFKALDVGCFGKHSISKDGLRKSCKKCRSEEHKRYREKLRVSPKATEEIRRKRAEYIRIWRANNPEKRAAQKRRYYEKHKERILVRQRIKTFVAEGCSEVELRKAISKFTGSCPICSDPTELKIDHCHRTKKVRGVLCGKCNCALGYAKDDPNLLRRLATYLEDSSVTETDNLSWSIQ